MLMHGIRSRVFPDIALFRRFMLHLVTHELAADTLGRDAAAALFARCIRDRIGNPNLLPPPLAPSTIVARQNRWGHYKLDPGAGASDTSTLLWTGRMKNSITSGHVALRESGAGSDDPKMVWHELGPKVGAHVPARAPLASTAREKNEEAFALYAQTFANALFNL